MQADERRSRDAPRLDYIDGLRAIAVGLVLWFHAQLPGVPHGYLGVDIFFVISGFLIPAQIVDRVANGSFAFRDFYARRVLRIGPPLLVVVSSVLVLTCVLPILPLDMTRIAWSAAASLAISANWYFLGGAGYFEVASEREPLLHLWSLAVEEQFYLIVPLVIVGLGYWARRGSRNLFVLGLLCAVATMVLSFGLTLAFARSKPSEVFYVTPMRAWEFAAGTVAALAIRYGFAIPRLPARAGVLIGLVAIACAAALPASDAGARLALQVLSVVAATAVLLCGAFAAGGLGASLLCLRPMVGIGLVSYALYLWHWPLLAFWRMSHLERPTLTQNVIVGIVIPLLLAVLSYVAIERPLRRWRQAGFVASRNARVIAQGIIASALLAVAAIMLVGWSKHLGGTDRYRPFDEAGRRIMEGCPMGARGNGPLPACSLGGDEGPPRVLLWGDSHALSASGAIAAIAGETGRRADLQWDGGCPPLPGNTLYVGGSVWTSCVRRNETTLNWLSTTTSDMASVTGVVLAGAWEGHRGRATLDGGSGEAGLRGLTEAMRISVGKLTDLGLRVLVLAPVPTLPYPATECLFLSGRENSARCHLPQRDLAQAHSAIVKALRDAMPASDNARLIDPAEAFCDAETCRAGRDGQIFYSDTHHLSAAGAQVLKDRFKDDLIWAFSAPARLKSP